MRFFIILFSRVRVRIKCLNLFFCIKFFICCCGVCACVCMYVYACFILIWLYILIRLFFWSFCLVIRVYSSLCVRYINSFLFLVEGEFMRSYFKCRLFCMFVGYVWRYLRILLFYEKLLVCGVGRVDMVIFVFR